MQSPTHSGDGRTPLNYARDSVLNEEGQEVTIGGEGRGTEQPHRPEDIVRLLVEHGAEDPEAAKADAVMAELHLACMLGKSTAIERLLEARADVNGLITRKADHATPLYHPYTPLQMVCQFGHLDTVRLLLQHGAVVHIANNEGRTPLHEACSGLERRSGHLEVVKLLLEHDADPTKADKYGDTPLSEARLDGHEDVVKLLVQHGAVDPEAAKADAVMAELLAEEEEASTNKKDRRARRRRRRRRRARSHRRRRRARHRSRAAPPT